MKKWINLMYLTIIVLLKLAIQLLKDQVPGTFIVRDSNSFPGAFGLALKVATPPPHAANRNGADPLVELVRHFLIEPTSKGVRIKGCTNEPVFGEFSGFFRIFQDFHAFSWFPLRILYLQES